MIEDYNLDEMFDQTVARAHNLSLQKQDCLFAFVNWREKPHHSLMILLTEKKGFQPTPNYKIIFKLSHQKKNQDIKKSGCYGSAGTHSYSFRFCSFMSA